MDANTARTILDLRNAVKLCELRQISGGRWLRPAANPRFLPSESGFARLSASNQKLFRCIFSNLVTVKIVIALGRRDLK